MPVYEYSCKDCKKDFVVSMSFKDAEKTVVKCEACKSDRVEKKYGGFTAMTSKKS